MELGSQNHSRDGLLGPNSIMVVYMDPLPPTRQTPPNPLRPHMGGCQNQGPLLGTLNTRCRTILRTQKETLILTTTHMNSWPEIRKPYIPETPKPEKL